MKDQVNKLAAQALAELAARGWNMETDPFNMFTDKFAELVIHECALQAETKLLKHIKSNETHQLSYNEGLCDGVAEFKKYFGFEK